MIYWNLVSWGMALPLREAVGIIFNLLTWNKIKWSVRKIDRKRFAALCLLQKREEDKMENCYNANECKKMNVQFYLLDTNYVIWKIHGIFPESKLNRRRTVAMRLDFKILEHFLNFYFHRNMVMCVLHYYKIAARQKGHVRFIIHTLWRGILHTKIYF